MERKKDFSIEHILSNVTQPEAGTLTDTSDDDSSRKTSGGMYVDVVTPSSWLQQHDFGCPPVPFFNRIWPHPLPIRRPFFGPQG